MAKPVIAVVDDEDDSLAALVHELESRYGLHYLVVACASPGLALAGWPSCGPSVAMCRWSWPTSGCLDRRGRSSWRR